MGFLDDIIYRSGLNRNLTPDEVDNNFLNLVNAIKALQGGTTPTTQLATPTGFAATATSASQIGTSWNNVANNSGYQVRVATDSNFTQNVFTQNTGANTTSLGLTGLAASTTYYAQVKALGTGSYSDSGYSAAVSATTQAGSAPSGPTLIGFGENSLSDGKGSTGWQPGSHPNGLIDLSKTDYPAQTMNLLGNGYSGLNFGVDGQKTTEFTARLSGEILPKMLAGTYSLRIMVLWEGTNHLSLSNGEVSAQQAYDAIVAQAQQVRAQGIKVIVASILPRYDAIYGISQAEFTSRKDYVNSQMAANWRNFADNYAPYHTIDGINYPDGIHLDDASYAKIATMAREKILQIVTNTVPGPGATPAPTITSFSPTSGAVGDLVTINGTNLTGATSLKLNGTTAAINSNNGSAIQTTVPAGATSGVWSVVTPGGTAVSTNSFTVTVAADSVVIDDDNAALSYYPLGSWAPGNNALAYNGILKYNNSSPDTASCVFDMTGNKLVVSTPATPIGGEYEVVVSGQVVGTAVQYAAQDTADVQCVVNFPDASRRTVTIRRKGGTSAGFIWVDKFTASGPNAAFYKTA
ncbi:IPT/TIG domain-containing protein [Hymenobacter fodinae]|uniref:Fibronectin type-III domain-containing protein n=1 Tax=Hymenobacter fodinae TaxID=2510796 RepID=A0A4Z0P588_9BACT|nr:IPT/TIG domain-containing protein [Hymenobacter fodinae]TGE05546.1 hypothetical protein EU556_19795 [Hymenobacter fodinae]